jgi:hypothetical protein
LASACTRDIGSAPLAQQGAHRRGQRLSVHPRSSFDIEDAVADANADARRGAC